MRMRQKIPNATGYKPRRKPAPKQPPTGARMVLLDDRGKGGWIADVMTAHMIDPSRCIEHWDGSSLIVPRPMNVTMTVGAPKYYATTRALLKAAARKPRGLKRPRTK